MNGETISRGQLLLQYYSAIAELEEEERQMASQAQLAARAAQVSTRVEQMLQPVALQKEVRASA
jgi:hypothetical protein